MYSPVPKKFQPVSTPDLQAITQQIDSMRELLFLVDQGILASNEYWCDDYEEYCRSLVKNQRDQLSNSIAGSWCVAHDDADMGADARVDFVFVPTYLAISLLVRLKLDFPNRADQVPSLDQSLKKGMHFATLRSFAGHGYDAEASVAEAIEILATGNIINFLHENPQYSPKMLKLLKELGMNAMERIRANNLNSAWGVNLENEFRSIAETLYILRDEIGIPDVVGNNAEEKWSEEPGW